MSDSYRRRNMRLCFISGDLEILIGETVDIVRNIFQNKLRQRAGRSRKLFSRLVEMIRIEMRIPQRVDEGSGLQLADSGNHVGQQRV